MTSFAWLRMTIGVDKRVNNARSVTVGTISKLLWGADLPLVSCGILG
jgi:hypothetical protein